jgi:hypothetical protein
VFCRSLYCEPLLYRIRSVFRHSKNNALKYWCSHEPQYVLNYSSKLKGFFVMTLSCFSVPLVRCLSNYGPRPRFGSRRYSEWVAIHFMKLLLIYIPFDQSAFFVNVISCSDVVALSAWPLWPLNIVGSAKQNYRFLRGSSRKVVKTNTWQNMEGFTLTTITEDTRGTRRVIN